MRKRMMGEVFDTEQAELIGESTFIEYRAGLRYREQLYYDSKLSDRWFVVQETGKPGDLADQGARQIIYCDEVDVRIWMEHEGVSVFEGPLVSDGKRRV